MAKKKTKRLGEAEFMGWDTHPVVEPDDREWGAPEQDTPLMEPPPPPPQCDRCRRVVSGNRYEHASAPGVPLCVDCYNFVVRQLKPRTKR